MEFRKYEKIHRLGKEEFEEKKVKQVYVDILHGDISVADQSNVQ